MDLEKLKAEYPDIVSAIRNEAISEGRKLERARLEAIEDVAMPGYADMVKAAKADESMTAEKLALNIVKAERARVRQAEADAQKDAAALDEVRFGDGNQGVAADESGQAALNAAVDAAREVISPNKTEA